MIVSKSEILKVTVSKLFPFIVVFSFFLFSYGPVSPGGGFQAGVILGTLVVIFEMCNERKIFSEMFYSLVEYIGVLILILALMIGLALTGRLFGGMYGFFTGSQVFANVYLWLLNLAIYLEVSGSMVLIFRYFIDWKSYDDELDIQEGE